jgi:hypothetical protein
MKSKDLWNVLALFFLSIALVTYMSEPFTKLHYITVATKPHPVLQIIQDRIRIEGSHVTVLGLEENRDIGWNAKANFGIKLREVYTFLQNPNLRANDIVLFTDAYDVALVGTQKEILQRYKQFHSPVVFGGETFCHPDSGRAAHYTSTQGTPFPYLNSGLFIGRVWALRKCMAGYSYQDAEDDQRFWTNAYFKHKHLITIDTHAKLFLNCAGLEHKKIVYDRFKRRLVYTEISSQPLLLHANGKDKSYLYTVIGRWKEPTKQDS